MANELGMDKRQIIQSLIRLGRSDRWIRQETGIHRKTIARYRKIFSEQNQNAPQVPPDFFGQKRQNGGQSVPQVPIDPKTLPGTQSIQILPFLQKIRDKLVRGYTRQRIYQDLVEEEGFSGSYDSIRRYAKKLKKSFPKHFSRLRTLPGQEGQVDFTRGPMVLDKGKRRRTWLFKFTLSFSGHSYEELVFKQDLETFIRCHENAFAFFGGVPETIKLDNLKSGVLKACLFEPVVNPVYLNFSKYWGFAPNPCAPYRPEHKGRVERDIQYTKSNALFGKEFSSLAAGNAYLRQWNKRWARTRIHGTHQTQVWKRFCDFDKPALKPLAEKPFALFKVAERKVDVHGHIEVSGNFYSVPPYYLGMQVQVQFNKEWVKVYQNHTRVATHRVQSGKGRCLTHPDHVPHYKPRTLEEAEGWQCRKAKEIGPNCHRLVYAMLSKDDPLGIRRTRGILTLRKKYPASIVETACERSLSNFAYSYGAVRNWCEYVVKNKSDPKPQLTQQHELIRGMEEYQAFIQERS